MQSGFHVFRLADTVHEGGVKAISLGEQGPVLAAFDNARLSPLVEAVIPHSHDAVSVVVEHQDFYGQIFLANGL